MAGDGQTDFYAEIGIKLNESQAKKEAAKGAKITADSIESAMIKAVQDVQAKQRKVLSSIMPKRQGFSLKESLKSGGSYMSSIQEKAFQREQEKTLKEELKKEKLLERENEKRIAKRIKEEEAERKRINKKDEADRKAKEKAEKAAEKEKERRQKREEILKEKAFKKDISRIKSLGKFALGSLGTALGGGYLAQRVGRDDYEMVGWHH